MLKESSHYSISFENVVYVRTNASESIKILSDSIPRVSFRDEPFSKYIHETPVDDTRFSIYIRSATLYAPWSKQSDWKNN